MDLPKTTLRLTAEKPMEHGILEYQGPNQIKDDVDRALQNLHTMIRTEVTEHRDHSVIRIYGLRQESIVVQGIAVYLVGAIASCVAFNMDVRAALFNEETLIRDLYRDVTNVIGENNDIDDEKKTYERNPWLWEGICHLLLHLSLMNGANPPPDRLLAKSSIHLDVKDHGLDIIALYGTDSLGVTAGECKAYLERPTDAIADAANRLGGVDRELRDAEIRATLSQFRPSLLPAKQKMLIGTFWHDERAYFPMVCCDSNHSVNWTVSRKVLKRLKPPANRKYLVPAPIDEADSFFDAVSDEMRRYASNNIVRANNV
ncbi:MAG: hypothetical protein K6T65_13165 [Peptococcaceae bacterium]|nr:hypothetical protein [Peptococcaceae bacterium]